jgi:hypothetical protein
MDWTAPAWRFEKGREADLISFFQDPKVAARQAQREMVGGFLGRADGAAMTGIIHASAGLCQATRQ